MQEAAVFYDGILSGNWQEEEVSSRAADYVAEETWQRIVDSRRHRKCTLLAGMASATLLGKDAIHGFVGSMAGEIAYLFGAGRVVKDFARELASNLPLPVDMKLITAARGLQATGILLCLINGDNLSECQCFIDLALTETKAALKALLTAATGDWVKLGSYA